MPRRTIERIREKIRLRAYDMTVHAAEEMAEDDLDILDMEQAILLDRSYEDKKMISEERSMLSRDLPLTAQLRWGSLVVF